MEKPDQSLPSSDDNLREYLAAANESAHHLNTLQLTFLALCTYIGLIIASTTDEQLLRVSPVTLPLLDVELPIWHFYLLVPWLVVVVHGHLLIRLYLLARQLHLFTSHVGTFAAESTRGTYTTLLYPLPFSHYLVDHGKDWVLRTLLGFIVGVTILSLPLFLIVWAQIQFFPYHDPMVTMSQHLAVLIDAATLLYMWPKIVVGYGSARSWWKEGGIRIWRKVSIPWMALRKMLRFLGVSPSCRVSGSQDNRTNSQGLGFLTLISLSALSIFLSFILVLLSGEPLLYPGLSLREKMLLANNLLPEVEAALLDPKTRKGVTKNVRGLSLTNRDLRSANFVEAVLVKADLRGVNLDGAYMNRAVLFEAKLGKSLSRKKTCVWEKQCFFANCRYCLTSLRRATLIGADLRQADLVRADLWRAALGGAHLEGADLGGAHLEGADLGGAHLEGADLPGAHLEGANLRGAHLEGADLRGTHLEGADLSKADFRASVLRGAGLGNANLTDAVFDHADVRDVFYLNLEYYENLKRELTNTIESPKILENVLDRIDPAKGTKLEISSAWNLLCEAQSKFLPCLDASEQQNIELYNHELLPYLRELACREPNCSWAGGSVNTL